AAPPCATSALCDAKAQVCHDPACDVGDHDCAQKDLLVCNPGRTGLVLQKTCQSVDLCDGAHGECDICTPGQYRCDGADLLQCDPPEQAEPVAVHCNSAAHCHADGATGTCYVCDDGQFNCTDAGVLQSCMDRAGFVDGPDCGDLAHCDAA